MRKPGHICATCDSFAFWGGCAACGLLLKAFDEITDGSRVLFPMSMAHNGVASPRRVNSDVGPYQTRSNVHRSHFRDGNALFVGTDKVRLYPRDPFSSYFNPHRKKQVARGPPAGGKYVFLVNHRSLRMAAWTGSRTPILRLSGGGHILGQPGWRRHRFLMSADVGAAFIFILGAPRVSPTAIHVIPLRGIAALQRRSCLWPICCGNRSIVAWLVTKTSTTPRGSPRTRPSFLHGGRECLLGVLPARLHAEVYRT